MFQRQDQFEEFMKLLELLMSACVKNDPSPARQSRMLKYYEKKKEFTDKWYTEGGG